MVRAIKIIIICLMLISCKNEYNKGNYYIELNNKVLLNQILEYKHFIDSISKGRTPLIKVYCYDTKDHKSKFVVTPISDAFSLTSEPYNFKCKIDTFEVFFTMVCGLVNSPDYGKTDLNFFKIKKDILINDAKRYFPEEFKSYQKYGSFTPTIIFEPDLLHLTFMHGVLIEKIYKRGMY